MTQVSIQPTNWRQMSDMDFKAGNDQVELGYYKKPLAAGETEVEGGHLIYEKSFANEPAAASPVTNHKDLGAIFYRSYKSKHFILPNCKSSSFYNIRVFFASFIYFIHSRK
jgi:hypothetical protein